MTDGSSILNVAIDFDRSHLFFPSIIHWLLLILALLIVVARGPAFIRKFRGFTHQDSKKKNSVDWKRLVGTLVVTIVYFSLMESIGEFFPNMGLGFLLTSIPFMFFLSMLYVHAPDRRELVTIVLSSIISPTVAWYVLAQMFNISLP